MKKVHVYNNSSTSVYVVIYPEEKKELVEISADRYFDVEEHIDVIAPHGGVKKYPSAEASPYGRISYGERPFNENDHRHWTIVVHNK